MGKAWTPEEKAILKEVSDSDLTLISQMHRLPGRTFSAARIHASRNDIGLKGPGMWSPAEIRILKKIYRGDESIKGAVAKLLPQRGYVAAKAEAVRLGLTGPKKRGRIGYSLVAAACEKALEDGQRFTADALSTKTGWKLHAVHRALAKARGKKFRVAEWTRLAIHGDFCAVWEIGTEPDAPRPARKHYSVSNREARVRRSIRAGNVNPFQTLINQVAA